MFSFPTSFRPIVLALTKGGENDIFNIGTGVPTSVNRLWEILAALEEKAAPTPVYARTTRTGELARSVLNADRSRKKLLGWTPAL